MNKILTLILIGLFSSALFAQSPESLSYQAVVRGADNNVLKTSPVGMRISIVQGSPNGNNVYIETHFPSTNENGLVTIEIGNGSVVNGNFANIDWANGPYFIRSEVDPNGGNNYSISGTSPLLSVPYAIHAKTAETVVGGISESDPQFNASPAAGIDGADVNNWNTAFGWGNHADAGYLTNLSETDPQFNASPAAGIDGAAINNWNAAFGWGNHANAGYLTNFSESDPQFNASPAAGIDGATINNWNTAFGWGNHANAGYLTNFTESDPLFGNSAASNINASDIANWNNAVAHSNATTGSVHGSTTVGGNLLRLPNPSATSFLRINADNSVSALNAANFRNAIGAGTGNGTVTSIQTNDGISGGTITSSGTIGLEGQALDLHNMNTNGFFVRAGSGNIQARTIEAGDGIEITDGDGVNGNPTIEIERYEVGDFVAGGIVFHVDASGQHGLVVSIEDVSSSLRWSDKTYGILGNPPTSLARDQQLYGGAMNTQLILAALAADNPNGNDFAALSCLNYKLTRNTFLNVSLHEGEWYLPSRDEMVLIYNNRNTINSAINNVLFYRKEPLGSERYWTSNEDEDCGDAYYVDFGNSGNIGSTRTSRPYRVRAVKRF